LRYGCLGCWALTDGHNTGGKGTPRHKQKRTVARSANDDKKLQTTLKKLNTQPIQAIEEVNMFKSDGNVIHFSAPTGTSYLGMPPIPRPPDKRPDNEIECLRTEEEKLRNMNADFFRVQSTPLSRPTPSPSMEPARTRS
jgi:hypothetical protein